jgi:hypothetical protein
MEFNAGQPKQSWAKFPLLFQQLLEVFDISSLGGLRDATAF